MTCSVCGAKMERGRKRYIYACPDCGRIEEDEPDCPGVDSKGVKE